jgi:serine/threonine protein phosphatase PrpC
VLYYGDTNIGNIRPKNEDAFVLKEVWGGSHLLAVVVDGVGSNGGGDVAANLACRCITDYFNGLDTSTDCLESLMGAVRFANNTICSEHYIPYLSQMSCVLTVAILNLENGRLEVCHVGDTRLYMLKDCVLTKVTSDHSIVGLKEESGQITEREAMAHHSRNIITRSIGKEMLYDGSEYIQTHTLHIEPCTLMLCSDGLYDMVHSSQMKRILQEPIPTDKRVVKLIDAALEAGGKDNVTVIVIDLMK